MKDIIVNHFKSHDVKSSKNIGKQDIDQAQIVFSHLKNNKGCIYSLIPNVWLNERGWEKLYKGIDKLLEKLF
jgi:excinuclease ABC subunit C